MLVSKRDTFLASLILPLSLSAFAVDTNCTLQVMQQKDPRVIKIKSDTPEGRVEKTLVGLSKDDIREYLYSGGANNDNPAGQIANRYLNNQEGRRWIAVSQYFANKSELEGVKQDRKWDTKNLDVFSPLSDEMHERKAQAAASLNGMTAETIQKKFDEVGLQKLNLTEQDYQQFQSLYPKVESQKATREEADKFNSIADKANSRYWPLLFAATATKKGEPPAQIAKKISGFQSAVQDENEIVQAILNRKHSGSALVDQKTIDSVAKAIENACNGNGGKVADMSGPVEGLELLSPARAVEAPKQAVSATAAVEPEPVAAPPVAATKPKRKPPPIDFTLSGSGGFQSTATQ